MTPRLEAGGFLWEPACFVLNLADPILAFGIDMVRALLSHTLGTLVAPATVSVWPAATLAHNNRTTAPTALDQAIGAPLAVGSLQTIHDDAGFTAVAGP